MIWHIFKKDLKIMWPFAVLVAAVHWVVPLLANMGDLATLTRRAQNILGTLVIAGPLAAGFLIAAAVQLDALLGVRQDWLIRPIRRRDLMVAKILFATLAVQLPILVADLTALLVNRVPLRLSAVSAVEHSILQMLIIDIPFIALASMTRNFLELLTGGVVLGVFAFVADILGSDNGSVEPIYRSGSGWILDLAAFIVMAGGALLVLRLQYFSRRAIVSWIVTAGAAVGFFLAWSMPWSFVFAIQRSVSSDPASSPAIAVNFAPDAGKFQRPAGGLTPEDALTIVRREFSGQVTVPIFLPIRVTGLPPDSAIQMDHAEVRIMDNGRIYKLEQEPWNTRHEGAGTGSSMVYPPIAVPEALFEQIKRQQTRVEVDYWLTLAEMYNSHAFPVTGADAQIPEAGQCRTSVNEQQTNVGIRCSTFGPRAACFHSFLENTTTGQRNPDRFACRMYGPIAGFVRNPIFPDYLLSDGLALPFRDPTGLAHYPVDGSKLREAQAVLQLYDVQDHFKRTLVIPDVRLADWEAASPGS